MNEFDNVLKEAKSGYNNSIIALVMFAGVGAFMWWGFVQIWFFIALTAFGILYSGFLTYYTYLGNKRIMEIKELAIKDPVETKNAIIKWAEEVVKSYELEVQKATSKASKGRGRRQARTNARFLKKRYEALKGIAEYIENNMI